MVGHFPHTQAPSSEPGASGLLRDLGLELLLETPNLDPRPPPSRPWVIRDVLGRAGPPVLPRTSLSWGHLKGCRRRLMLQRGFSTPRRGQV